MDVKIVSGQCQEKEGKNMLAPISTRATHMMKSGEGRFFLNPLIGATNLRREMPNLKHLHKVPQACHEI